MGCQASTRARPRPTPGPTTRPPRCPAPAPTRPATSARRAGTRSNTTPRRLPSSAAPRIGRPTQKAGTTAPSRSASPALIPSQASTVCTTTNYGGPDNAAASGQRHLHRQGRQHERPVPVRPQVRRDGAAVTAATPQRTPERQWLVQPRRRVQFPGTDTTSGVAACPPVDLQRDRRARRRPSSGRCRDQRRQRRRPRLPAQVRRHRRRPRPARSRRVEPDIGDWYNAPVAIDLQRHRRAIRRRHVRDRDLRRARTGRGIGCPAPAPTRRATSAPRSRARAQVRRDRRRRSRPPPGARRQRERLVQPRRRLSRSAAPTRPRALRAARARPTAGRTARPRRSWDVHRQRRQLGQRVVPRSSTTPPPRRHGPQRRDRTRTPVVGTTAPVDVTFSGTDATSGVDTCAAVDLLRARRTAARCPALHRQGRQHQRARGLRRSSTTPPHRP